MSGVGVEREALVIANGLFVVVRKDTDLEQAGLPPYSSSDGHLYRRDELEFFLDE